MSDNVLQHWSLAGWLFPLVAGILIGFQVGILGGCILWGVRKRSLRIHGELEKLNSNVEHGINRSQDSQNSQSCSCCENHRSFPIEAPAVPDIRNIGSVEGSAELPKPQRPSSRSSYPSYFWGRSNERSSSVNPAAGWWSTSSGSTWSNIVSTLEHTSPLVEPLHPRSNMLGSVLPQTLVHPGSEASEPRDIDRGQPIPAMNVDSPTPETSPVGAPVLPQQPLPTTGWSITEECLVPREHIQRPNSVIGISGEFGGDVPRRPGGDVYEPDVPSSRNEHESSTEPHLSPQPTKIRPPPGSLADFVFNNPPTSHERGLSVSSGPPNLRRSRTAGGPTTNRQASMVSAPKDPSPHTL
ncbi:hypothetical protein TWF506_007396 [Arthrobotrys conoides]|uniref:Uncharacterized protein n=1 Tax=Arthrobotrys conoides TaxID=74498 RepID=A0AAN8NP26_9PEZI